MKLSNTPAATAEAITPATFGPIACISRKFCGLDSKPTLFDTRAAIGTADTPAEPINGLILLLVLNLFITLAMITPMAVPMLNATMPKDKIPKVFIFRNDSAESLDPTVKPKPIVTILISVLREVWLDALPHRFHALGYQRQTYLLEAQHL